MRITTPFETYPSAENTVGRVRTLLAVLSWPVLPMASMQRWVGAQAEATALAALQLEGCDLDVNLRALDVLPLVAPERGAPAGPQRLKLNGRAKFSGRLAAPAADADEV